MVDKTIYNKYEKKYEDFFIELMWQIYEEKYPTLYGDLNDMDLYYDDNNYDWEWEEMKENKELMAKLFSK